MIANSCSMELVICTPWLLFSIIDIQNVLLFFLTNVECRRSFRVIIFSRFDGVVVDSEEDVVDVDLGSDASIPPVELRLYNTTEMTCMDLQYDPMTLLTRGQLATLNNNFYLRRTKVDVRKTM